MGGGGRQLQAEAVTKMLTERCGWKKNYISQKAGMGKSPAPCGKSKIVGQAGSICNLYFLYLYFFYTGWIKPHFYLVNPATLCQQALIVLSGVCASLDFLSIL